jgi:hypothetical protein
MKPRTIMIAGGALVLLLVLRPWADDAAPVEDPAPPAAAPVAPRAFTPRGGTIARVPREPAEVRARASRRDADPARNDELTPDEQQAHHDRRAAAQAVLLAKAFAADGRDPTWSPQTEDALRDAFAAAAPPGARLEEVACGATLCRFTAAFDSIAERDEGVGALLGLVRWRSLGFGNPSPDDPRRYVVHAARDPESFPSVE